MPQFLSTFPKRLNITDLVAAISAATQGYDDSLNDIKATLKEHEKHSGVPYLLTEDELHQLTEFFMNKYLNPEIRRFLVENFGNQMLNFAVKAKPFRLIGNAKLRKLNKLREKPHPDLAERLLAFGDIDVHAKDAEGLTALNHLFRGGHALWLDHIFGLLLKKKITATVTPDLINFLENMLKATEMIDPQTYFFEYNSLLRLKISHFYDDFYVNHFVPKPSYAIKSTDELIAGIFKVLANHLILSKDSDQTWETVLLAAQKGEVIFNFILDVISAGLTESEFQIFLQSLAVHFIKTSMLSFGEIPKNYMSKINFNAVAEDTSLYMYCLSDATTPDFLFEKLVLQKADLNIQTANPVSLSNQAIAVGSSCLHLAILFHNEDAVAKLLKSSINLTLTTQDGQDAFQLALQQLVSTDPIQQKFARKHMLILYHLAKASPDLLIKHQATINQVIQPTQFCQLTHLQTVFKLISYQAELAKIAKSPMAQASFLNEKPTFLQNFLPELSEPKEIMKRAEEIEELLYRAIRGDTTNFLCIEQAPYEQIIKYGKLHNICKEITQHYYPHPIKSHKPYRALSIPSFINV